MTRLGTGIAVLIVLVLAAFASMVSFGPAPRTASPSDAPQQTAADVPQSVAAPRGYLTVPVAGHSRAAIQDSWGDARSGGLRAHHGTDIMAAAGTPVVAAAAGRVEKLFQSALGGTTLYQRSADGRWIFYYAHLAGYAPGVHEGQVVRAGQPLAYVGDTGDAGPGNYHLHFGMTRMRPGQRWYQGEDVNPYPILARAPPAR